MVEGVQYGEDTSSVRTRMCSTDLSHHLLCTTEEGV